MVEPEHYCPILPMVLINGAEGIGTGWAVKIPNFNIKGNFFFCFFKKSKFICYKNTKVIKLFFLIFELLKIQKEIIENLIRLINKQELVPMKPYYKNFRGTIERLDDQRYLVSGEVALINDDNDSKNDYTVEISELPVGVWTQAYKESVLEVFLHGSSESTAAKSGPAGGGGGGGFTQLINDYKEYHTDCTVRFLVKMSSKQYAHAMEQGGLHKFFKLQKTISLTNMVLFDSKGCLKRCVCKNYTRKIKYYIHQF